MGSCCSKESQEDPSGLSGGAAKNVEKNDRSQENGQIPAQPAAAPSPVPNELVEQLKAGLPRKLQSLKEMREDLALRPGMFMLNNLMMAVDFFPDYTAK